MNWINLIALLPTLISAVGGMLNTAAPASAPVNGAAVTTLLQTEESFIKLVQEALNAVQLLGIVSFGAPLRVDGIAGPLTTAAIQSLLTHFNVKL